MNKMKQIGAILALALVACMAAVPQMAASAQTGWTLAGTGWVDGNGGSCFAPNGTSECEPAAVPLLGENYDIEVAVKVIQAGGSYVIDSGGGGVDDNYFILHPGHAPIYAGTVTHYCGGGICSGGMIFTYGNAYLAVFHMYESFSSGASNSMTVSAAAGGMCGSAQHPVPCLMLN